MSLAITTKFLGPTDHRGSRIKAVAGDGRPTPEKKFTLLLPWDDALNVFENHKAAALALAKQLDWDGKWYAGDTEGDGYVFVRDGQGPAFAIKGAKR